MSASSPATEAETTLLSPSTLTTAEHLDDEKTGVERQRPENEAATSQLQPKKRRKTSVRFGSVQVYTHKPQLAGDRVPTNGPSVGLGELEHVQVRRIDSFDERRELERRGVNYLDPSERRNLVGLSRSESIDEVEAEAEQVRRAREASLLHCEEASEGEPSPRTKAVEALEPGLFSLKEQPSDTPSLSDLFG